MSTGIAGVVRRGCAVIAVIALAVASSPAVAAGDGTAGRMLIDVAGWFLAPEQWAGPDGLPMRLLEHVGYVSASLAVAIVIALPVGIGLGHTGRGGLVAINVANIGRALPSLGIVILVFLMAGFGTVPILVALVALAIPPMVTNSYVGMRSVDPAIREAARAMGMTGGQMLWQVELPIALPLIMAGLRNSAVQVVSTATLAAYVGLGGLGRYLIDGLATRQLVPVIGGAIVVALLAMLTELSLGRLQRWVVSKGLVNQ